MRVHPSYIDLYLEKGFPLVLLGVFLLFFPDLVTKYEMFDLVPGEMEFNEFALTFRLLGVFVILLGHVYAFLIQRNTYLDIKPNMIEFKTGILFWKSSKVPYETITDFKITRNLLNVLLGTGNLFINTSGKDGYEIIFKSGLMDDLRMVEYEIRERIKARKKK